LYNTANLQFKAINDKMPDLVTPPPTYGTQSDTLPSGKKRLTAEERKKLENYRLRKQGGQ
jgi:hypothetical protein